jgi:hypothetical protein
LGTETTGFSKVIATEIWISHSQYQTLRHPPKQLLSQQVMHPQAINQFRRLQTIQPILPSLKEFLHIHQSCNLRFNKTVDFYTTT